MADEMTTGQRYELRNRYHMSGNLEMQTAFHIGGGGRMTLSASNSPVVLTPDSKPYIPGSSFKGALRSTIEKIIPSLPESAGLFTCGLPTVEDEHARCPTARLNTLNKELRGMKEGEAKKRMDEERGKICHTCQLFGSAFAAARININDLYIVEDRWSGRIETRDGVAIDRDSEKAKDRLKYDFEVVPAQAIFALRITLENATPEDLQIVCVGLSEFVNGFGYIGGKRSRGLGACRLEELKAEALELENKREQERSKILKRFLIERKMEEVNGEDFLRNHIEKIFEEKTV